jgi:Phasin protein.
MADAKKARAPRARKQVSALKPGPELALETSRSEPVSDVPPTPPAAEAPLRAHTGRDRMAEPMQFSRFGQERTEALRQALSEAALATAHGALEVNDKIIAALQRQSETAIDLWRSALDAPHMADALRLHTDGSRQAYETATAQWKEIAEATTRWFHRSLEPFHSVLADRTR